MLVLLGRQEGRKVAASGHGDVLDVLLRPREGEGEVEGCRRTIVCISGESGLAIPTVREGETRP